jgi:hypothetical protein
MRTLYLATGPHVTDDWWLMNWRGSERKGWSSNQSSVTCVIHMRTRCQVKGPHVTDDWQPFLSDPLQFISHQSSVTCIGDWWIEEDLKGRVGALIKSHMRTRCQVKVIIVRTADVSQRQAGIRTQVAALFRRQSPIAIKQRISVSQQTAGVDLSIHSNRALPWQWLSLRRCLHGRPGGPVGEMSLSILGPGDSAAVLAGKLG